MPILRWDELYESRLDWAERAYATFLHSIDEEIARDFERKGEVTVVLYGRTQVGKTTLLLKILGIAEEHFAHVSEVLRGGRETGKSATATATRYTRSMDDLWRIGQDDDTPLDDHALEQALASLRKQVEAGSYSSDDPVSIRIPRYYFAQQAPSIDVRILDLPGTHSANANERRHVARIAARFVPAADVVLLVGRANALGFLKPEELGLEELQYWPHSPERFKIILTHTYSAQSTKDWIAERGGCDIEAIRQHMLGQLRTHDFTLPERLVDSLFPIEFGGSWEALRITDDPVFPQVEPVVSQLIDDLSSEVLKSATKYARIRSAFSVHSAIKEKRQADVKKLSARKEKLACAAESALARLRATEVEIDEQKGIASDIAKKVAKLEKAHLKDRSAVASIISSRTGNLSNTAKNVVVIQEFIASAKGDYKTQWDEVCDEVSMGGAAAALGDYPRGPVDACFREIGNILSSYSGPFSNTYLWLDNYLRDREAALEARKLAASTLRDHAEALLDQIATKERVRLTRLQKKVHAQLEALQSSKGALQKSLRESERAVAEAKDEIRRFVEESKSKESRARRFDRHLKSAFEDELQLQCSGIAAADSPVEKFSRLCFTVLLGDEYRKLES